MRTRLFGLLAASLVAVSAQATPVLNIDGGSGPTHLGGAGQYTITFSITPDADAVSGFNLTLDLANPGVSLVSCVAAQNNCAPGAAVISLGAALSANQTALFTAGTITFNYDGVTTGSLISLRGTSTITTGDLNSDPAVWFTDVFVGPAIVAVPEPATAGLLALGLGGLAILGRKRIA